jgi:GNAT superfamily N-acetyltransferase
MEVVDLTEEQENLFLCCLEDWSDEAKEAGPRRGAWYNTMKEKGLRVKLAKDDKGVVGGMIQYMPIERAWVSGHDLFFVMCVWVHGHKEGRGNLQGKGMGKALLKAAEEDARALGAKGMAAWGLTMPIWMKASWFKRRGYKRVDKDGMAALMWKPFTPDAVPPQWITERKRPRPVPGRVTVTSFVNGWCMAQNLVYERAKRAVAEFGDKVELKEIDTSDPDVMNEWGIVDGLFVDGKQVRTGPPPSYEKIRKLIAKRVKRLR